MAPKGMSLKLHLLSGEGIEAQKEKDYQKYNLITKAEKFKLSNEQKDSLKELIKNDNKFRVHVLQGTTGSGKTIVYFNALKKKIDQEFQGLILLPEIGLASEFQNKFKEFFGYRSCCMAFINNKKK